MYEYHDCGTFESIVPIDARWTAIRGGPFGMPSYLFFFLAKQRETKASNTMRVGIDCM